MDVMFSRMSSVSEKLLFVQEFRGSQENVTKATSKVGDKKEQAAPVLPDKASRIYSI